MYCKFGYHVSFDPPRRVLDGHLDCMTLIINKELNNRCVNREDYEQ